MARVLFFGSAWIALLAALAMAAGMGAPRARVAAAAAAVKRPVPPVPPPPPPRVGARFPGWTVTRAYSAHHMMIVEVEAARLDDASKIAAQVVEPIKDRFDEVLIYVRGPGQRAADFPARRVQWTRRTGYLVSAYPR